MTGNPIGLPRRMLLQRMLLENREKPQSVSGDAGKMAIVVRAICGAKTAGAAFRNALADCMQKLGLQTLHGLSRSVDEEVPKCQQTRNGAGVISPLCGRHTRCSSCHCVTIETSQQTCASRDPGMCFGGKVSKQWVNDDDGTSCGC